MSFIKHSPIWDKTLVDKFFNHSLSDIVGSDFTTTHPSVNIYEKDDVYYLEVAAPGLEKDDFHVNVDKGQLTISVEKEIDADAVPGSYRRNEFNYTRFNRKFHLPKTIDSEGIDAKYLKGVLTLTLPKKEEAKVKPAVNIEIK